MPEKTEEEFTSYAHARRWFKTGDIGEFQGRKIHICSQITIQYILDSQKLVMPLMAFLTWQNSRKAAGLGKLLSKSIQDTDTVTVSVTRV